MANTVRHEHEKVQICELFRQRKVSRIEDRFVIMNEFLNREGHISTVELIEVLHAKGYTFSFEFVRDTMLLLEKFGFAESKLFATEMQEPLHSHLPEHQHHHHRHNSVVHTKRWEHRHLGMHHDHMICTLCNKIIEFNSPELEALQERIAKERDFHMLQHKMVIYGLCDECFNARNLEPSLTEIKPGEKAVIVSFEGPNDAKLRLGNMGFYRGQTVELVSLSSQNVVVISQLQRFVLDYELASYIKVEPINSLDC